MREPGCTVRLTKENQMRVPVPPTRFDPSAMAYCQLEATQPSPTPRRLAACRNARDPVEYGRRHHPQEWRHAARHVSRMRLDAEAEFGSDLATGH